MKLYINDYTFILSEMSTYRGCVKNLFRDDALQPLPNKKKQILQKNEKTDLQLK